MSADTGHFVYRAFDADGVLLYVGRTKNPQQRVNNHRSSTPWWPRVERIDWEPIGSLLDAGVAELIAIREEAPLFNVDGASDRAAARGRLLEANGEPEWRQRAFQQGACRRCADARTAVQHAGKSCVESALERLQPGEACEGGRDHAMRVLERFADMAAAS